MEIRRWLLGLLVLPVLLTLLVPAAAPPPRPRPSVGSARHRQDVRPLTHLPDPQITQNASRDIAPPTFIPESHSHVSLCLPARPPAQSRPVALGQGTARTFSTTDLAGTPTTLGVALSEAAMTGPP